eukprot:Partr_v1_DN25452_c1_g1_i5_m53494 putative ubiquitin-conjugating enzyme
MASQYLKRDRGYMSRYSKSRFLLSFSAFRMPLTFKEWSPALTIKTALISLQSLLQCPEPDDPQDHEVAKQYICDRSAFNDTARYWASAFAPIPTPSDVQRALAMGYSERASTLALVLHGLDCEKAFERLLS